MTRRVRIAVLTSVLAVVLLYAWNDVRRRRSRNDWQRTLEVALVVLQRGEVDARALATLRHRAPELEARLGREMSRYLKTDFAHPVSFTFYGPVEVSASPPSPTDDTVSELVAHAYRSWRYFGEVDARADVPSRGFDARIYLVVRPPESRHRKSVEGQSEQGGRIGQVEVELDETMVDFALFVAAHELMHTLGATDKYDALGRARAPEGLADPRRVPLYPQDAAEVMARNVAVDAQRERPPESLDELVVGEATAREIGWLSAPAP